MGAAYFGGVLRGLCASAGTPRRVDSAKPVTARLKPAGPRGTCSGAYVDAPYLARQAIDCALSMAHFLESWSRAKRI